MNYAEICAKYAFVADAMPFKYRIWKNNKVVKSGSLDKDDDATLTNAAKMSGKDWDKITLHDPKMKQLKRVSNPNASKTSSSSSNPAKMNAPVVGSVKANNASGTAKFKANVYVEPVDLKKPYKSMDVVRFEALVSSRTPEEIKRIADAKYGKMGWSKAGYYASGLPEVKNASFFKKLNEFEKRDVDEQVKKYLAKGKIPDIQVVNGHGFYVTNNVYEAFSKTAKGKALIEKKKKEDAKKPKKEYVPYSHGGDFLMRHPEASST